MRGWVAVDDLPRRGGSLVFRVSAWVVLLSVGLLPARLDAQSNTGDALRALRRAGIPLRPVSTATSSGASWQVYGMPGGMLATSGSGHLASAGDWQAIGLASACRNAATRVVTPSLIAATSQASDVGALAGQVSEVAAPTLNAVSATNSAVTSVAAAAVGGVGGLLRERGGVLGLVGDMVAGAGADAHDVANRAVASATGVDLRQLESTLALVVGEGRAVAGDAGTMAAVVARLSAGANGSDVGDACEHLMPLASAAGAFSARLTPLVERVEQAGAAARAVASLVPSQSVHEVVSRVEQLQYRVASLREPVARVAQEAHLASSEYQAEGVAVAQQLRAGTVAAVSSALASHREMLAGYVRLAASPIVRSSAVEGTARPVADLALAQQLVASDPTEALRAIDRAYLGARDVLSARPELFVRALMREAGMRAEAQWVGLPSTDAIWGASRVAQAAMHAQDPDRVLRALQLGMAAAAAYDDRLPWVQGGVVLLAVAFLGGVAWLWHSRSWAPRGRRSVAVALFAGLAVHVPSTPLSPSPGEENPSVQESNQQSVREPGWPCEQ